MLATTRPGGPILCSTQKPGHRLDYQYLSCRHRKPSWM